MHEIILTFKVKGLVNLDADNFAASMAEHVLDTFNDNDSIVPFVGMETKEVTE